MWLLSSAALERLLKLRKLNFFKCPCVSKWKARSCKQRSCQPLYGYSSVSTWKRCQKQKCWNQETSL